MSAPRQWRKLKRHPLSAQYADIKGRAWTKFVENLRARGNVQQRKIMLYEGQIIDGWQFHRAHVEIGRPGDYRMLRLPKGVTAEEWVESVNDDRRHETQEAAMARAEERRKRVAEARAEGQSTRTIAEAEGISPSQVQRDLETASGVPGGTPEPPDGKIVGRDGRKQAASKTKLLCERCQRNAPGFGVPGCQACEVARREAKVKRKTEPLPRPASDLPDSVQNALADTWHLECAQTLARIKTQCKRAFNWSVYLDHEVIGHLKLAEEYFLAAVPKKPCKICKGQKRVENKLCMDCKGSGYIASSA